MTRAVMGLSRVAVLVGAGVAGSVVLRNGRLAEILGELQEILDKGQKGKGGDEDSDMNDVLTKQIQELVEAIVLPMTHKDRFQS
ncbi:hypothetical protein GUJ93_ZPchr0007g5947 [Zizania palustris]|uniref:Uncharacterized protein n=1 Tax=Zizania palustris TaxID=103762 RepID=A0A8J5TES0_ZIZPA|nr:hypothetical protein GUJ93_ZPchr0007g5947 [Zizania palustris]